MPEQMSDKIRNLFLIFKRAVEREREAQKMYQEALSLCEDELARKVLEELYQDEVRHEHHVMENYNRLRKEWKMRADG